MDISQPDQYTLVTDLVRDLKVSEQIEVIPLSSHLLGGLAFIVYKSRPTIGFLVPMKVSDSPPGEREPKGPQAGLTFPLATGGHCPPILFADLTMLFSGNNAGSKHCLTELVKACHEKGIKDVCAGKLSHGGEALIKLDNVAFYDGHEFHPFFTTSKEIADDEAIIIAHRQIIIPRALAA